MKNLLKFLIVPTLLFSFAIACEKNCDTEYILKTDTIFVNDTVYIIDTVVVNPADSIIPYDTVYGLGGGFRYSAYGPQYDPGPEYWNSVGMRMATNFNGASPECIWIVGVIIGNGCRLNFPVEGSYPNISGSATDHNEEIFDLFDQNGYRVWLQVEPGNASIDTLIDIVMARYKHHPCITGFGIDVEWLETTTPIGRQVTDAEAIRWVNRTKTHNQKYRVFFKHWEVEKMPPSVRTDIVFIDDSQMFSNLSQMVNEFEYWGNYFYPADVGFQYGYEADETWWGSFENPPKVIGDALIEQIPNAKSLFWVDFTIIDVFPPRK